MVPQVANGGEPLCRRPRPRSPAVRSHLGDLLGRRHDGRHLGSAPAVSPCVSTVVRTAGAASNQQRQRPCRHCLSIFHKILSVASPGMHDLFAQPATSSRLNAQPERLPCIEKLGKWTGRPRSFSSSRVKHVSGQLNKSDLERNSVPARQARMDHLGRSGRPGGADETLSCCHEVAVERLGEIADTSQKAFSAHTRPA